MTIETFRSFSHIASSAFDLQKKRGEKKMSGLDTSFGKVENGQGSFQINPIYRLEDQRPDEKADISAQRLVLVSRAKQLESWSTGFDCSEIRLLIKQKLNQILLK
jgi:hypothetical protein